MPDSMPGSSILFTGATGLLSGYLGPNLEKLGTVIRVARSSSRGVMGCNLIDPHEVDKLTKQVRPKYVVHAAALTDVDYCEDNPTDAFNVNCNAVKNPVNALDPNVYFLYISTDQVYSGVGAPHEEGAPRPVNTYGRSKLSGERILTDIPNSVILRTNFFGNSRTNGKASIDDFFIKKISSREKLSLFNDIIFSPLHMSTLSQLIVELLQKEVTGVFNAGSRYGMSKAEFAIQLASIFGWNLDHAEVVSSDSRIRGAPRPKDMRMDVSKIENAVGRSMPCLMGEIKKVVKLRDVVNTDG